MATEADTCRTLITPKLQVSGWETEPHSILEQRFFTDGRIVVHGNKALRRKGKRADYILRYARDFAIAVVEAKPNDEPAALGVSESRYQIWAYKECTRQDVAHTLASFIHEVSPTTEIIVHRDSDYLDADDEARLKQTYQNLGLSLFLTPGVDVEGVFCRLAHLKAVNANQTKAIDEIYPQALTACAAEFKEKAKRGAEEIDNLRHKSGIPTKGKEAIGNWAAGLDVSTERWIHGKTLLATLRELFQQITKTNLNVELPSPVLRLPSLETLLPRPSLPRVATPAATTPVPLPVASAAAPTIISTSRQS